MRRLFLPLLLASLAACTLSLPAGKGESPAPAALIPGTVEVTSLDAPSPAAAQAEAAPESLPSAPPSASGAASAPAAAPPPTLRPQPRPTTTGAPPATEPATAQASPPASPEQLACEAKGGIWSKTGASPLRTCLQPTRDAGKSCRKESDCDGLCLARSRTCAPVKPLFGCNPILQDDGSEAVLCID